MTIIITMTWVTANLCLPCPGLLLLTGVTRPVLGLRLSWPGAGLVAGPPPPGRTLDNTRIDSGAGTILSPSTGHHRAQWCILHDFHQVVQACQFWLEAALAPCHILLHRPVPGGWPGMCQVGGAGQCPCLGTSRSDTSDQISAGQPAAPRRWRPGQPSHYNSYNKQSHH